MMLLMHLKLPMMMGNVRPPRARHRYRFLMRVTVVLISQYCFRPALLSSITRRNVENCYDTAGCYRTLHLRQRFDCECPEMGIFFTRRVFPFQPDSRAAPAGRRCYSPVSALWLFMAGTVSTTEFSWRFPARLRPAEAPVRGAP